MSVNQRIISALAPLGLPVVPDVDSVHHQRCFTFNFTQQPVQWADNRPLYWRFLIQIHLFCPLTENSLALREAAPSALAAGGFTWPEILDQSDEEGQHFVFETTTIEKLEV